MFLDLFAYNRWSRLMRVLIKFAVGILILLVMSCGQKSAGLQDTADPPDTILYENGMKFLEKSQYIKSRLAFQTLINTYPDSEFTPVAFMSIAESYYRAGGTSNLLQAEAQYKDFIVFYPTHEMADDAQMKIAAINFRLMREPDRDPTYSKKAMRELKKMTRDYPDSPLSTTAQEVLWEVEENLATGIQLKGDFYHDRGRNKASASRYEDILDRFGDYSQLDHVIFSLAEALEEDGRVDEAGRYYEQLAKEFPFSGHHKQAVNKLKDLERPIPEIDQVEADRHLANSLRSDKDFSLFDPIRSAWSTLSGGKDIYEEARRRAEEREEESLSDRKTNETENDL
jgi:outer membrane protein assembly factor BamD